MIDDRDLDALLAASLAEIPDRGFSARVAARMEHNASRWENAVFWAPIAATAIALPFIPFHELSAALLRVSPEIASSGALAVAAAILALTLSLDRSWQESQ